MLFAYKPRPGAPKSKVNEALIAKVRKQIEEDPNNTIRDTSSDLDTFLFTLCYLKNWVLVRYLRECRMC